MPNAAPIKRYTRLLAIILPNGYIIRFRFIFVIMYFVDGLHELWAVSEGRRPHLVQSKATHRIHGSPLAVSPLNPDSIVE